MMGSSNADFVGSNCEDNVVTWSLYTAPDEQITPDLLRAFISEQREARLMTESMTLELKERRHSDNVARAVAGFANTEGGIILVGISEDDPSFDGAPGVSPSEVVAIGDSCRSLLAPLVQMSIVPVPLPAGDKVVIVIRVDADPSVRPVVKAGTVMVRAPGQTVPASHEQIIAMVARSQNPSTIDVPTFSLMDSFRPAYDANRGQFRDALIRVAGGVWLRPSASEMVFGVKQRAQLRESLEQSPLFLYPALGSFDWRRPERRPDCVEGAFTASTASFEIEYPQDDDAYRVSARFRRDGYRISYALDLELRTQSRLDRGAPPRLGRNELTTALLAGVETAALLLPEVVATIANSAPQRVESIYAWALNGGLSFDVLLDLSRDERASENSMGSQWSLEMEAPRTTDEVATSIRSQLVSLYLDLGLQHAESLADQDVIRGQLELGRIGDELIL